MDQSCGLRESIAEIRAESEWGSYAQAGNGMLPSLSIWKPTTKAELENCAWNQLPKQDEIGRLLSVAVQYNGRLNSGGTMRAAIKLFALTIACACPALWAQPTQPAPQMPQTVGVTSAPPVAAPLSQPAATTGDVLDVTRQVLEMSKEHTARSHEYFRNLFIALGAIAGVISFLGYRQIQTLTQPYRDKLAALEVSHQEAMKAQLEAFAERVEMNAKAQVVASTIWDTINDFETAEGQQLTDQLKEVVRLVDFAMPPESEGKLDEYLSGVLLIRKAYAQKRLGDYAGAFNSAARAVELNKQTAANWWYYNAACYASLAGRGEEVCCALLELAITANVAARTDALEDEDFTNVRTSLQFIALTTAP